MKLTVIGILLAALGLAPSVQASLQPMDLRCDYAVNPLGVDSATPRLFWKLASARRGEHQTAYEIIVAASQEELEQSKGWDSGKVVSDETTQIVFPAVNLKSNQQFFWRVRVWDASGKMSGWSKPATWTEGILYPDDWRAKWISATDAELASTLLRHEWVVKPGLKRALVNVCGLGQYELTLNGKKVGENWLSPGWSKYDRTCLYDTLDVTSYLQGGTNAIGVMLGNGMYNVIGGTNRFTKFHGSFGPQKAIAQIRLEYGDGMVELLGTDESWRVARGPITFSSIYGGEDFDARLVQTGWDQPGFDDTSWAAATVAEGPGGVLKGLSCAAPPLHLFELQRPIATHTLTNGGEFFDLGQNASHIPTLRVSGPAGSRVRIMPAELTNADGTISQGSMGAGHRGAVWCDFTKATDGVEEWMPKFFYAGCRYYSVQFYPAISGGELPRVRSLTARVFHSASDPVGEFECSNPLFNRIHQLVRWAQRSNMVSLMTDCPHRERLGWLEEDHLNGPSLRYEFDLAQLFTKTMNDIADSQLTNGLVPTTAPEYTIFRNKNDPDHLRNDFGDSPEWSSTLILVPWQQYEFDGDLGLFRLHYDAIKSYLTFFSSRAGNNIVSYGLGDWYDVGPKHPGYSQLTPIPLTATAFYYQDVAIMAQVANLLGKTDDATAYADLAQNIRTAFNQKFYNADTHSYATDSQCANAIPLVMGLCEPTNRAGVLDSIIRDVRDRGDALTAGDVGYRYLLRALADGGRSDVIFDMNNQSDKPGYGLQLKKGATSLAEAWDAGRGSSQDHFMLGQIMEWFYHDLGGISSDPAGPGFKKIIINPQPVGDVTWVKASFDSIHGKIVCHWQRSEGMFKLHLKIPANTTATIFLPVRAGGMVKEGGDPVEQAAGVEFLRHEEGRAVYEVESGEYDFSSKI